MQIALQATDDFEEWRSHARSLIRMGVPPGDVTWANDGGSRDLFVDAVRPPPPVIGAAPVHASREFIRAAQSACLHASCERFALLYRILWRLQGNRDLMADAADPDVRRLAILAKQVGRDIHKMRAFVRFRGFADADGRERFVAWFEPDHHIVRVNAGFFVRRFAAMDWAIATPATSIWWDGQQLWEGPGGRREDYPESDAFEDLWRGYYRSIFNPARLKVNAMLREMPRRYWSNLPEAAEIADLIAGARKRELAMIDAGSGPDDPPPRDMAALREGVDRCARCAIAACASRAVHGEGPQDAAVMLVGEQPGDQEDLAGRPFVGPAGQLLDEALAAAGIDRAACYVTNAVRHFKHERRGKIRLHKTPSAGEIDLCRWWLDAERALIRPRMIIALGASAARGVLGRTDSITRLRQRPHPLEDGTTVRVTVHPSYLLRLPADQRAAAFAQFVADLTAARADLAGATGGGALGGAETN